jgi:hypothetical protein
MKLVNLISNRFNVSLDKLIKKDIPMATAFGLRGLIKKIQSEYKTYNECRTELMDKYGDKDEKGKLVYKENKELQITDPEKEKLLESKMQELLNLEITVPKFKIAEFGKIDVTTELLLSLEDIIDFEEEKIESDIAKFMKSKEKTIEKMDEVKPALKAVEDQDSK